MTTCGPHSRITFPRVKSDRVLTVGHKIPRCCWEREARVGEWKWLYCVKFHYWELQVTWKVAIKFNEGEREKRLTLYACVHQLLWEAYHLHTMDSFWNPPPWTGSRDHQICICIQPHVTAMCTYRPVTIRIFGCSRPLIPISCIFYFQPASAHLPVIFQAIL